MLNFPFPDERVFRYQAMQDILHHLVTNPVEEFTQEELGSITGADISSISRSVDLLDKLGIITISTDRPARISIDTDHLQHSDPIFLIPQAEFRKPLQGYLDRLEECVQDSTEIDTLVGIILFGSVAQGAADRRSDIDLLIIVDGDLTYARRICTSLARDLEGESFDGNRYEFEVLVETPDTAVTHSQELSKIFDEGLVLNQSEQLKEVRQTIYETSEEDNSNAD